MNTITAVKANELFKAYFKDDRAWNVKEDCFIDVTEEDIALGIFEDSDELYLDYSGSDVEGFQSTYVIMTGCGYSFPLHHSVIGNI